ncbi:MAG: endolytic transglycosylase MltG, partial [Flavobacteriales bacterium]|nr:endolytic transglycosylase MltG [Flavobacteriales bacterium]
MKKKTIIRIGLLLIAVGIAVCVLMYSKLFGSATAFTGESVILEISTGSTYPDLREQLLREQIISSGSVFDWASKLKKFGSQIKPGRYKVKRGASYNGIINMIRSGDQVPVRLEIPACRTLAHLAGVLGKQLEADSSRYAE